ncbi:MAG: cation:proton antiporter [Chthonomonadales bacterium]
MELNTLIQLGIVLAVAKAAAEGAERLLRMPPVLGEILAGAVIGGSGLACIHASNPSLAFLAEIGAVLLLLEVGLASEARRLMRVGGGALWVAACGVAFTVTLSYAVLSRMNTPAPIALFAAASLCATSVGITARVFADLGRLQTREAQLVLAAAVADDVLGLVLIAAVTGLALHHAWSPASIGRVLALAGFFLTASLVLGSRLAPRMLGIAHRMQTRAALSTWAVAFCMAMAGLAQAAGLAAIVGAFAAGLLMANTEHKAHLQGRVKAAADLFVPVFFVMMGARMDLHLLSPATPSGRASLVVAGLLLAAVTVGKVLAGISVPMRSIGRLQVGIGMVPQGEVSLISASIGLGAGILPHSLYAAMVLVVIFNTLITPPLLKLTAASSTQKGGTEFKPIVESSAALGRDAGVP